MAERHAPTESRRRQLIGGALLIGAVGLLAVFLWLGRAMPGIFGEWFGIVAGIVSTPFLMEASFVVLGFMIVLGLNLWRQRRDGDEFVYLEQVVGPESETLPDSARWAVYKDKPLDPENPDVRVVIEGALEIGDLERAGALLAELGPEQLAEPEILRLRLRLAEASGEADKAAELRQRLADH